MKWSNIGVRNSPFANRRSRSKAYRRCVYAIYYVLNISSLHLGAQCPVHRRPTPTVHHLSSAGTKFYCTKQRNEFVNFVYDLGRACDEATYGKSSRQSVVRDGPKWWEQPNGWLILQKNYLTECAFGEVLALSSPTDGPGVFLKSIASGHKSTLFLRCIPWSVWVCVNQPCFRPGSGSLSLPLSHS